MSEDYRTIITTVGQSKFAAAISGGAPVALSEMAIGDSGGVGYNPDENQAGLVNEVYRAALFSVETLSGGVIVCTMTVPITEGGWHIREAAIYDDVGAFLAVVRLADRYKPLPSSGQADELTIKFKMDVGNVGAVTWAIDPDRKDDMSAQIVPDYRSVKTLQNDPPVDPAPVAGETWIVGNAPTGAWVNREKFLAEWTGAGWVFQPPIPWFLVGLENRTDMRFDSVAGEWIVWKASVAHPGPIQIAPDPTDLADASNALTPSHINALRQNWDWKTEDLGGNKVAVADNHRTLFYCSAPLTLSLPDAADVGEGWVIWVRNRSAGDVVLSPAGGTVNGLATMPLRIWHGGYIISDGANFRLVRTESTPLTSGASGSPVAMPHGTPVIVPLLGPSINQLGVSWSAGAPSRLYIPSDLKRLTIFVRAAYQLNAGGYRDVGALKNGVRASYWARVQAVGNATALPTWSNPPIDVAHNDYFEMVQEQGSGIALVSDTNGVIFLTGTEWV